MSTLEWMLLEQLLHVDVWARAAIWSPMGPIVASVLLALICGFVVAIARTSRRALRVLLAVLTSSTRIPRRPHPGQRRDSALTPEPRGARGPRAPAAVPVG